MSTFTRGYSYGFPMVFLWFSHGFPVVFPLFFLLKLPFIEDVPEGSCSQVAIFLRAAHIVHPSVKGPALVGELMRAAARHVVPKKGYSEGRVPFILWFFIGKSLISMVRFPAMFDETGG